MAYQKLTPIVSDGSSAPRYLGERFAETVNVMDFGAKGNWKTDDTQSIRAAFDYALGRIQNAEALGCTVYFPPGTYLVSDELFSDEFQAAIWNNSYTERYIVVQGAGAGSTTIRISSEWASGVRNTANGNQRTYGPWANGPSPSIVFPCIQDASRGNPMSISIKGIRLRQLTPRIGRDPIPLFFRTELSAIHSDVTALGFANWGEVVMGSFNSNRTNIKIISCGQQPSEIGKCFVNIPAGFTSKAVAFDFDASTLTVTAKAKIDCQGYSAGSNLPIFKTDHIGKTFWISNCDQNSMPLETVIASVSGDYCSAVVTVSKTYGTPINGTGVGGSFTPVKAATTADSAVVTLSAPICFGRGARDMVGMLVAIPHAGSKGAVGTVRVSDILVSRIASCDVGNDSDGYTQVTLTEPARYAVSGEDFITSASHFDGYDERARLDHASHATWSVNDTDWLTCQWENSADGVADSPNTSAYMFISDNAGSAAQFVSCKIHGANPVATQCACDGSVIIDDSVGIDFIGCNFTHMVCSGKGVVRAMGTCNKVNLTNVHLDDYKLPKGVMPIYLDPEPTGWTTNNFYVTTKAFEVNNSLYTISNFDGYFYASNAINWQTTQPPLALYSNRIAEVVKGSDYFEGMFLLKLRDDDNLDNIKHNGRYLIGHNNVSGSVPNGEHSFLDVYQYGSWVCQRIVDLDNRDTYERNYYNNNGTWVWSNWKSLGTPSASTAEFQNKTSNVNTRGKAYLSFAYNTTDYKLYISRGNDATSPWRSANGSDLITPS